MTIERINNRVTFQCDGCLDEYEGDSGQEFAEVWNAARELGWRSYKDDLEDVWVHKCPNCMKKRVRT